MAGGSDTTGLLRNPAAFNNVLGLRPSMGRVPDGPAPDGWLGNLRGYLPLGMQLIGRPQADLAVLRMAQAHAHAQRSADILARRPGALSSL